MWKAWHTDCGILYVCFLQKIKSFFSEPIHPQLLVNLDFIRKKHSLSQRLPYCLLVMVRFKNIP